MRKALHDASRLLSDYLIASGLKPEFAFLINLLVNISLVMLLWYMIHQVTRRVLVATLRNFTNKTRTTFDDFLVSSNFPRYISNVLPLGLLVLAIPAVFQKYPRLQNFLESLVDIYIIILMVLVARSILRTTTNYMKHHAQFKDKPLESYTQVLMIVFWSIGLIFIFSVLTGKSVVGYLVSLGAASAIILFIFKDTILGFVASIHVSVNDIVRIGDWITFSKYGADGFVTEINLATVRVQNWDMTYTTIPTYNLIADSFNNWRGMEESQGRRIKRSLFIKQKSVRFVGEQDLERLRGVDLVRGYIKEKQQEIDQYNQDQDIDKKFLINGRHQTNLGIFRRYALNYLNTHPLVHQEMTIMVRHLPPTTQGIPLEVYCFSKDKRWEQYEDLTADIFDHLIAALPYFDLKLFEVPSGDDIIQGLQESKRNMDLHSV